MGFWHWLKKRKKLISMKHNPVHENAVQAAFRRVKRDIDALQTDLIEVNHRIAAHEKMIADNTRNLTAQSARLDKLENIVNSAPMESSGTETHEISRLIPSISRPKPSTNRLVATKIDTEASPCLDVNYLSPQEKKIISVFMAHRDMALSYIDIAKSLGKSPHTVKNQIRQFNTKVPLFDKLADAGNANRFRLKKNLKIETNLDTD